MVSSQHSRSRSRSSGVRNLSARVQAELSRDEARPGDNAWVTEEYRKSANILKGFETAADSRIKLRTAFPRNPHSELYEHMTSMTDELQAIKNLKNM